MSEQEGTNGTLKNDMVIQWAKDLLRKETNHNGSICPTGEFEIRGIARRMRERLHLDTDKTGDIYIETTYKKRTQETRDTFLSALLPADYPSSSLHYLNGSTCEHLVDSDGNVDRSLFASYAPLRFFSICPVASPSPSPLELPEGEDEPESAAGGGGEFPVQPRHAASGGRQRHLVGVTPLAGQSDHAAQDRHAAPPLLPLSARSLLLQRLCPLLRAVTARARRAAPAGLR